MSDNNENRQRILLIDDDAISREVLSMMLEIHGFPVDSAEDGAQALKLLEQTQEQSEHFPSVILPDVILMDTQMPGLSGLELVAAMRAKIKAPTRIVAISGSEVSEELRLATDGFLLKPIEIESLVALLKDDRKPVTPEATSPPPSSDASEIIDLAVLAKLKVMMPPAALKEVYTAVASDLETRLVTLESAIEAENAIEVARTAHTIKGGCGMVGLTAAREPAARLETSNRPETWRKDLLQLHFALNKLKDILSNGLL